LYVCKIIHGLAFFFGGGGGVRLGQTRKWKWAIHTWDTYRLHKSCAGVCGYGPERHGVLDQANPSLWLKGSWASWHEVQQTAVKSCLV